MISLYDIGWGLARTGRFAGQTDIWYSVLPHTFAVANLVPEEFKLEALLHDAAEAVLGDTVATWKHPMVKSQEYEILSILYENLGLTDRWEYEHGMSPEVLEADLAARSAEAVLLGHSTPDGAFFVEIRESNPELYHKALDLTDAMIDTFTAEYCIYKTSDAAADFEAAVQNEIQKVLA